MPEQSVWETLVRIWAQQDLLCILYTHTHTHTHVFIGFPDGSNAKESVCNVRKPSSIPGLGISPGEGNGNSLQCSCLKNSMDRGTWWTTVHGVTKESDMMNNQDTHTELY